MRQPLKAFQSFFCDSSAPGIYRPRRMSRLIQHSTKPAVWQTSDGFEWYNVNNREHNVANEESLFRYKHSGKNTEQSSILFYCLNGSGIIKREQRPLKRFHQPVEEAKARPFFQQLTLPLCPCIRVIYSIFMLIFVSVLFCCVFSLLYYILSYTAVLRQPSYSLHGLVFTCVFVRSALPCSHFSRNSCYISKRLRICCSRLKQN